MCECERREDDGDEPRVHGGERTDRDAESRDDVLDPEAGGREKPGFAEAVPAAEPQHHCEQDMVDDDEDAGRNQAGQREAEIALLAERLDGEPRREAAEREVRDVERLDVPRVAVADRERSVQCENEYDDEERRQHERAGDHERRRGVEAVVPADGDAEQRRDGGERKQDRERQPLVLRRRVSCDGDGRRDESGKGDDGRVGGGRGRQAAHSPGLPPPVSCNCWDAHSAAAPLCQGPRTVAVTDFLLTIGNAKRRRYPKRVTGAYSESGIATPPREYDPQRSSSTNRRSA